MNNVKELKKEATDFLGKKGRRIDMVFYCLILVFVLISPIFIFYYTQYLVLWGIAALPVKLTNAELLSSVIALAAAIALALFASLPVVHSYFKYSYKLYREGIAGRVSYFSHGKREYGRSLSGGFFIGLFMAACASPLMVLVELLRPFAVHPDKRISSLVSYLFFLVVALGLVLGFGVFLLLRPMFLFCYYTSRGYSVGSSFSMSVKNMRSARAKRLYMDYIKAFLPDMLLSAATLLIWFVIDTLPRMTLVYQRIADEIAYNEE